MNHMQVLVNPSFTPTNTTLMHFRIWELTLIICSQKQITKPEGEIFLNVARSIFSEINVWMQV